MKYLSKSSTHSPEFLLILIAFFVLSSCEGISSSSNQENKNDTSFSHTEQASGSMDEIMDTKEQQSRGLDMNHARISSLALEDQFPLLHQACKEDQKLLNDLEAYAKRVLSGDLSSEADILEILENRDSSLIPFITPLFENMDPQKLDQNWGAYQEELNKLGMNMTAAEGMFTSIGSAPFLEDKITELGSEEFRAYVKFKNAHTESLNGEYPFQNMKPFRDMVIYGEKVLNGSNEAYKKSIDEDFQYALEAFTDIHFVSSPGSRQVDVVLVGGTHTDLHPFLAELETAKEFVGSDQASDYKLALSRILENPSQISEKPENIYVVVIEWADNKTMAQSRVRSHLSKGEDVPHYLKIRRGDGTDQYAVSYRFYENEEKANNAFDEAVKVFPNARLIFCSVRNGNLYQLGI